MDNSAPSTVNCFVSKHIPGQVVPVLIHACKPPHWLESDDLLDAYLLVNCTGELPNILKTTFTKEFENLPVPFVVFEGMDFVVFGINRRREHTV